ncbi:allantoate permease [Fusarium agapanthi]|uniref:Allantoate permease n=1 Tax=Fusarium agapanthi TaxID=1803897 RepID=A0A9P5B8X5_9HYPO|nr:allantoate permease [Fusarium agapanthi]
MSDKGSVNIAEKTDNAKVSLDEGAGFTEADTKRLIRKIDWTIIPFVSLLYLLSFLDPRVRPQHVRNPIQHGYEAVQALDLDPLYDGRLEYLLNPDGITMWYRRHECGFRMAIFFSAATAAGVFGGFLARGIMEMRGLLTVAVALASFKLMADYPDRAKFITDAERKHIQERLMLDRLGLAEEFEMKYVWDAFKDWKIWVHMLIATGTFTGVYSYSLFLPTIIRDLGYSSTTAQLMSTPPYLVACFVCVVAGWWADKIQQRGIFMIVFITMAGLGLILLMTVCHSGVRYFGCFLLASGIFPSVPQGIAWNSNNIGGSLKRGVGIAMNVSCGNLGGIVASYLFLTKDASRYFPGFGTLLGCQVMALVLSIWMAIYLRRENARRDATHKDPSLYAEDEKQTERGKGDNATFLRYTI